MHKSARRSTERAKRIRGVASWRVGMSCA
ncbi:hypothetical protein RHECNPAF_4310094 [Rhizobium etli CNPAF512]|nr:hypothetical protein RHECNPAF_4310094 [Rhizobium etli CNPAF512]